jgi:hypothetical protein
MRSFLFLTLAVVTTAVSGAIPAQQPASASATNSLSTQTLDGRTRITFDAAGRVIRLTRTDQAGQKINIPLGAGESGLFIDDPIGHKTYRIGTTDSSVRGIPARIETVQDGIKETASIPAANLKIEATYRFLPDGALAVDGALVDLSGTDRVANVGFTLPLEAVGGAWQAGLTKETQITPEMKPESQSDFPMATVVGPESQYAIAYSVPPDHPARFEITYGPAGGFTIVMKFGLSPSGKGALHSRAPFAFTVDLADGRWGLRDTLKHYYSRSPEWFEDRSHHFGFWTGGTPIDYTAFDPSLVAFHGSGSHSVHVKTVDEYVRNEGWRFDRHYGIFNLSYLICGQQEITDLHSLPTSYSQAMAALKNWTHLPMLFSAHNFPNSYRNAADHKESIVNSGLFDPDGRYVMRIRNTEWGGDSVTFPVNPNPNLYADTNKKTVAKYLLGDYVQKMMKSPYMDGAIVDSLGGFAAYYNYRHSHFAYEQVPLSYDDRVMKPAIYNGISETEFLWGLRSLLHANGKVLAANNTQFKVSSPSPLKPLPFITFALDVVTSEGAGQTSKTGNAALYRIMTYRKPLIFHIGEIPNGRAWPPGGIDLVKNSVLQDFFVSGGPVNSNGEFYENPAAELEYQRKYSPILVRLAKAGWEPITGVKTGDAEVLAERYGEPKDFHVVLYNTSGSEKHLTLSIDHSVVDWSANVKIDDLLPDSHFGPERAKMLMESGRLNLAAGEELVLHIQSSGGNSH